jgi:NAD(P)-dependent dehydrogenase (short-subunit alcohol dehydrogenase family)
MTVDGKVVVVTGAARGLGRGFAKALAGARLVLNSRDAVALEALADELRAGGTSVVTVPGSVTDDDVCASIIGAAVREFGRLDVLVNNAGIVRDRSTLKMTPEEFDDVIAVNLRGAWSCGRHAAAAMRETGGAIVNVVSEVAFYGAFGQSNYSASKAGLVALTLAWSVELAKHGIRVNAFSPAAETDMSRVVIDRLRVDGAEPDLAALGIGSVDQIGPLVDFLASDLSEKLTGQVFSFDGRHLGVWSHPQTVSVAVRDQWTADDIGRAFDAGELVAQATSRPSWRD